MPFSTAEEVLAELRPQILGVFSEEIKAANGRVIVHAGQMAAIQISHLDSWGTDVRVFTEPIGEAAGYIGPEDMAGKFRPVTADEIRAWLSRAEAMEGATS